MPTDMTDDPRPKLRALLSEREITDEPRLERDGRRYCVLLGDDPVPIGSDDTEVGAYWDAIGTVLEWAP